MDILSSYCFSIIKAMSTLCVAPNELGKINAVLSALENLLPVVAVKAYAGVWGVIGFRSIMMFKVKIFSYI